MRTFQFLYRIIRSATEKAALSKEQKEVREGVLRITGRRNFQGEETASAKALR